MKMFTVGSSSVKPTLFGGWLLTFFVLNILAAVLETGLLLIFLIKGGELSSTSFMILSILSAAIVLNTLYIIITTSERSFTRPGAIQKALTISVILTFARSFVALRIFSPNLNEWLKDLLLDCIGQSWKAVAWALIWAFYFRRSKRVRAYFNEDVPHEQIKIIQRTHVLKKHFTKAIVILFTLLTAGILVMGFPIYSRFSEMRKGGEYANAGNYNEALEIFDKAITTYPLKGHRHQLAFAHKVRAFIFKKKGNFDAALSDYNAAIQLDSKNAEIYRARGIIYLKKKALDQAFSDFETAIAINPNYAAAYNDRGFVYYEKGAFNHAISDYNHVIELHPDNHAVYYNRGLAFYSAQEYIKALADYRTAIRINPDKEAYEEFIRYVPTKIPSDLEDVREKIIQLFKNAMA